MKSNSSSQQATVIQYQSNAVRVVVPLSAIAHACYFVLLKPNEEGVCGVDYIVKEEVFFFFTQCRYENMTAYGKMERSWAMIVVKEYSVASQAIKILLE